MRVTVHKGKFPLVAPILQYFHRFFLSTDPSIHKKLENCPTKFDMYGDDWPDFTMGMFVSL